VTSSGPPDLVSAEASELIFWRVLNVPVRPFAAQLNVAGVIRSQPVPDANVRPDATAKSRLSVPSM
jgi:hypothetical protein